MRCLYESRHPHRAAIARASLLRRDNFFQLQLEGLVEMRAPPRQVCTLRAPHDPLCAARLQWRIAIEVSRG